MKRSGARARVQRAKAELDQAELQLAACCKPWRERLGRHRLALLIGGGLLGGFALARASPRRWSRIGAAVFGSSAWLARSPVGPALLAAVWTALSGRTHAPRSPPGAVAESAAPTHS
jgi:hypothetical protein